MSWVKQDTNALKPYTHSDCASLVTAQWCKQLHKCADVVLTLKPHAPFWDKSQDEPLLLALCLPLIRHFPWQIRNTQLVAQLLEWDLRGLPQDFLEWAGPLLRKFLDTTRALDGMSESLVWELLCPAPIG